MLRVIFLSFFLLLMGSLSAQKAKKDTTRSLDPAADLYKASLKLIDSLKYKDAIKTLQKAVKKYEEAIEPFLLARARGLSALGLHTFNFLQQNLFVTFGIHFLVNLAQRSFRIDHKRGAVPVHRTFVGALPHARGRKKFVIWIGQ